MRICRRISTNAGIVSICRNILINFPPSIVLSLDELPIGNRDDVRWQNVREWLQADW